MPPNLGRRQAVRSRSRRGWRWLHCEPRRCRAALVSCRVAVMPRRPRRSSLERWCHPAVAGQVKMPPLAVAVFSQGVSPSLKSTSAVSVSSRRWHRHRRVAKKRRHWSPSPTPSPTGAHLATSAFSSSTHLPMSHKSFILGRERATLLRRYRNAMRSYKRKRKKKEQRRPGERRWSGGSLGRLHRWQLCPTQTLSRPKPLQT